MREASDWDLRADGAEKLSRSTDLQSVAFTLVRGREDSDDRALLVAKELGSLEIAFQERAVEENGGGLTLAKCRKSGLKALGGL